MTVGVVYEFEGATLSQYDEVLKELGVSPRGKSAAPECVFHWVTETKSGIQVTDVWESREAFGRFAEELGPITQKVGFPNPPVPVFHEVHNYLTEG
jgi:hypothetical protein